MHTLMPNACLLFRPRTHRVKTVLVWDS